MNLLKRIFLSEKIILSVILLNAIVITWLAFPEYRNNSNLKILDEIFIWFFIVEMLVKWKALGIKNYFNSAWNKFDFFLVMVSIPSILLDLFPSVFWFIPQTSLLLAFRLFRLLRIFGFIRFIPHMNQMMKGIVRALKASVFVFFALLFLNFMFALFGCHMFGDIAPDYFGDPMVAGYSIFQMFTIEGWYEIPGAVAEGMSNPALIWLMRLYFIGVVMLGGIFGMSLVNAIFVDEMTMDNNDDLEIKVDQLQEQIAELKSLLIENKGNQE